MRKMEKNIHKKYSGNLYRLIGLIKKNLRWNFRDRANYFWVFGYPLIFITIFALAYDTSSSRSTYSIAIINNDIIGANNELEQNASITLVNLFNGSQSTSNLSETFLLQTQLKNGSIMTEQLAMELVQKGQIDAVIIIPENFTENIIGSTWWYRQFRSPEFQSLPSAVQQGFLNSLPSEWAAVVTNQSVNLPMNASIELGVHTKPDIVTKTVITSVFDGLVNSIICGYNNITNAEIVVTTPGVVEELTIFDWLGPSMVIIGVTVAIMMVAQTFGTEKEKGLLKRLDTTPVPRWTMLLSGGIAQLIYSSIQIIILFAVLKFIFGLQSSPNTNWFLAYLAALMVVLPCIGIGLIIGSVVKNGGEAGGLAWIAILPIQFLCNVLFNLGDNIIVKLNPATYGASAIQNVVVRGLGFADIWMDLMINLFMGIALIIIGLVIFQKKSQV